MPTPGAGGGGIAPPRTLVDGSGAAVGVAGNALSADISDRSARLLGAASITRTAVGIRTSFWNAAAVSAGGVSAPGALLPAAQWVIFGNASAATTLTVQISSDNANWVTTSVSVAANGDFNIDCRSLFGAYYVRLLSSAAATITAGVMGQS